MLVLVMRIFSKIIIAVAILLSGTTPARADYFVWRDAVTGLSLSFPDTWKIVSSKNPKDIITLNAPADRGFASCRVSVNDDRRYVIYPQRYNENIQHTALGDDFWHKYANRYDNGQVYSSKNSASLGRGWAGFAEIGYDGAVQGPYMRRDAVVLASIYNGDMYLVECSANQEAFPQWRSSFMAVANSIDFIPAYHQLRTGNYRDFLKDPHIAFPNIARDRYDIY